MTTRTASNGVRLKALTATDGAVNEKLIKLCRNTLDDTDAESRKRDFAMLMEQLRPEDAAAMHEEISRLANLYRHESARVRADTSMVADDVQVRFKLALSGVGKL